MTVDIRGAAYAASRISSTLKGNTKQFGWLRAPATNFPLPSNTSVWHGSAKPFFVNVLWSDRAQRCYVGISEDPEMRRQPHNHLGKDWLYLSDFM
jgi:hypothetical protein